MSKWIDIDSDINEARKEMRKKSQNQPVWKWTCKICWCVYLFARSIANFNSINELIETLCCNCSCSCSSHSTQSADQPTIVSIKLTRTFNDGITIFVCVHCYWHVYMYNIERLQLSMCNTYENKIISNCIYLFWGKFHRHRHRHHDGLSILNLPLLHWYVYWHVYEFFFTAYRA